MTVLVGEGRASRRGAIEGIMPGGRAVDSEKPEKNGKPLR
jgi:hypothetical protein